jgi:hypothetical protein
VNRGLLAEIHEMSEEAKKVNMLAQSGQRVTDETNNQILALKSNHEERKLRFESQIKGLQERLKEKDDGYESSGANKENTSFLANTKDKKSLTSGGEFSNPTAVLKLRVSRWTQNNKDKKHLMDVYTRNVKIIEDAFG